MSGGVEDPRQCDVIKDDLAELALGTLSGRRRSEVLNHVESCPRCRAELERLAIVADTLLQLAPEVDPPVGFELRLAERLQAGAAMHRPSRFRLASALSAAAAVVILALGFGLGTLTAPGNANHQGQSVIANLTTANLTSHGQVIGEVMISAGNPAWMFMTIDRGAWPGKVTCDVTLAGGKVETVGVFTLSSGYGAWGAPLTSPASQVHSARLIAANGTILASARFSI